MTTYPIYECDVCKKTYKKEVAARKHEELCKTKKAEEDYRIANYDKISNEIRLSLDSWDNSVIAETIISWVLKYYKIPITIKLNVGYQDCVSNSHGCPLDGIENWHAKPELPKGYPGFRGRINFIFEKKEHYEIFYKGRIFEHHTYGQSTSNPKLVGFFTGCGGGNGLILGYDFYFFLSDFPLMLPKWEAIYYPKKLREMLSEWR
jgi:hypothetical protein